MDRCHYCEQVATLFTDPDGNMVCEQCLENLKILRLQLARGMNVEDIKRGLEQAMDETLEDLREHGEGTD